MVSIFSKPNILLRLEGLALLALGLAVYVKLAYSWPLFWAVLLLPDLALLAYLLNKEVGAVAYNITHAKLLPALLAVIALVLGHAGALAVAIIWFIHIGVDRFLGYGLKYTQGFKFTHLGTLGERESGPEKYQLPGFCGK
jgi:hypothetical protein